MSPVKKVKNPVKKVENQDSPIYNDGGIYSPILTILTKSDSLDQDFQFQLTQEEEEVMSGFFHKLVECHLDMQNRTGIEYLSNLSDNEPVYLKVLCTLNNKKVRNLMAEKCRDHVIAIYMEKVNQVLENHRKDPDNPSTKEAILDLESELKSRYEIATVPREKSIYLNFLVKINNYFLFYNPHIKK